MNAGADVQSFESLGDWHAALSQFKEDAQNGLVAVALVLQRAADWLAEQKQHWQREIRRAEDVLVTARTALRNKQHEDWSGRNPDTTVEEKDLKKALAHLEFCEAQHDRTRRWMQKLPTVIEDAYAGPSRKLAFFLDSDLPHALALLSRQLIALEQYAAAPPPMREQP